MDQVDGLNFQLGCADEGIRNGSVSVKRPILNPFIDELCLPEGIVTTSRRVYSPVEKAIVDYFWAGHSINTIVSLLSKKGFKIKERSVRMKMKNLNLGLRRMQSLYTIEMIKKAVQFELDMHGGTSGYREMHRKLRFRHFMVAKRYITAPSIDNILGIFL